jgi:hypothetical protein
MMGLVCQAIVGSLIGAVILRAACAWYNSMTGRSRGTSGAMAAPAEMMQFPAASSNPYEAPTVASRMDSGNSSVGVPEPDFGRAWLISFVTIMANGVVGFAAGMVVGVGGAAAGINSEMAMLFSLVISLPVSFLVASGLLAAMLPTSIGRAMIVALLYLAISLMVGIAIAVVVMGAIFLFVGFR